MFDTDFFARSRSLSFSSCLYCWNNIERKIGFHLKPTHSSAYGTNRMKRVRVSETATNKHKKSCHMCMMFAIESIFHVFNSTARTLTTYIHTHATIGLSFYLQNCKNKINPFVWLPLWICINVSSIFAEYINLFPCTVCSKQHTHTDTFALYCWSNKFAFV